MIIVKTSPTTLLHGKLESKYRFLMHSLTSFMSTYMVLHSCRKWIQVMKEHKILAIMDQFSKWGDKTKEGNKQRKKSNFRLWIMQKTWYDFCQLGVQLFALGFGFSTPLISISFLSLVKTKGISWRSSG